MLLYHYCSVDIFLSIIKNKSLWLTDLANTNDSEEIRFGMRQLYKLYEELAGSKPSKFFDDFLWMTNKGAYACCFSEDGDLLSQWRGYADDGKGFSIGFDFDAIDVKKRYPQFQPFEKNNLLAYEKVLYEDSDFLSLINNLPIFKQSKDKLDIEHHNLDSLRVLLNEKRKKKDDNSLSDFDQFFISLGSIAFFMKNPSFKEEKEWRLL